MQIVIDITKETYKRLIKKEYCHAETVDLVKMFNSVKKGTPLPKGHGRIADMDEAIKCIEEVEGDDAVWAISLIEWACGKRTLIEADKAESEIEE